MSVSIFWATGVFSLFCAVVAAFVAKKLVLRNSALYGTVAMESSDTILKNAQNQREIVLAEALKAAQAQFKEEDERLDEERAVVIRIQEDFEKELSTKQSEVDKRENELLSQAIEVESKLQVIESIKEQNQKIVEEKKEIAVELERSLATRCNIKREELEKSCFEEIMNAEKLGVSRWLVENQENLKLEAKTYAKDVLNAVYVRYNPKFIWPKTSFAVETPSLAIAQRYFNEGSEIISLLTENTETAIDLMISGEEPPTLKISGGAGVDKELIRLTLEEALLRNQLSPDRLRIQMAKHRKHLDRFTLRLGEEACRILGLPLVHPEILKLIGSLNYRTSHRQNQYFHSIEVARLAGMIADEVGVDSQLAKRSGLLHDIGKALDYRIEGSHAVISGDYATRYGEAEDVIDTVLAHHDDKVVETPHAYILKAADAMSGARPGARVDMEEGYLKRIEGIAEVVNSFQEMGVTGTNIMHAGREVHVFVDNRRIKEHDVLNLAENICKKLESDVQFPGQIKVTVVRRFEVSEVA